MRRKIKEGETIRVITHGGEELTVQLWRSQRREAMLDINCAEIKSLGRDEEKPNRLTKRTKLA